MWFSPIWPSEDRSWNFDVSSLMILIGEDQELQYRLSCRSLSQCLLGSPVIGLQSYIRSYDLLLDLGSLTVTTPYGRASAPLRNKRLEKTIKLQGLLQDGRFTMYQIPARPEQATRAGNEDPLLLLWVIFTWLYFAGTVVFSLFMPKVSWIGISNVVCLSAWSIVIRVIEYINVRPAPLVLSTVTEPQRPDAVYILGRNNSAFVLRGSREDIKRWVTQDLIYDNNLPVPTTILQSFTRLGSLLVLFLIFSTIPNGHTMDQLAFILLNILAQANVLVGQQLNSRTCLSELQLLESATVLSRTHVYGMLVGQFRELGSEWIEDVGLLPKTAIWDEWRCEMLKHTLQDPKALYNKILQEHRAVEKKPSV